MTWKLESARPSSSTCTPRYLMSHSGDLMSSAKIPRSSGAAGKTGMASFVHHLRRGVVLRLELRRALDELRGGDQRELFAVDELAQRVAELLAAQLEPRALAEPLPERRAEDRDAEVGEDLRVGIDRGVPGEGRGRVPLVAFRVLVEPGELGVARGVVPVDGPLAREGIGLDARRQRLAHRNASSSPLSRTNVRLSTQTEERPRLRRLRGFEQALGGALLDDAPAGEHER